MAKLLLIDGHSIINRAFYGVPELTNAAGLHVNAIYGFLNIMFKLMDDEQPDYMCVAFDVKAKTFRHERFDMYKGTRKPMPEELHEQVPVLKELLGAMNIRTFERAGWEADDILGSLAKRAEAEGLEVSLVSGDRDLLQIATDKIKICIPKTSGGRTETRYYYTQDVISEYEVPPSGIIELKALMGDSSDNIPGVPKVGQKTATELLKLYGTVDGVYEHIDEITKKGLHANLVEYKDQAYLSKWLATIKTDCDTGLEWDELLIGDIYNSDAYDFLARLEMKSILKRFDGSRTKKSTGEETKNFTLVSDMPEYDRVMSKLRESEAGLVAFYIETEDQAVVSVSVTYSSDTYVIIPRFFLTEDYVIDGLCSLIADRKHRFITFDAKKAYSYVGTECADIIDDALIECYLLNPLKSDIDVEYISVKYLDMTLRGRAETFGKVRLSDATMSMEEEYRVYAGYRSYVLGAVSSMVADRLKELGMYELYTDIELPLAKVLYDCEREGIRIDSNKLTEYGRKLEERILELEQSIYDKAGENFNINSPKQLGEILFEKLGLSGGKKTKTGYSTAADVLEKLAPDNPIIADILEYRGLTKLKSTYVEGLIGCIREDGRIHTCFNQTITATGRISSTEPNLQNIPIRTAQGREIRRCFIPKEGYNFVDADYSQIELRLLAHMSKDSELIASYETDADIHRITASKVFHIPFDEVTPEKRRDAKAVNFGLVYGISSFGLSQDLGITKKEAAEYIEEYFRTYPGVKEFLDSTVENAKKDGYVTTIYGRRRPVPELSSSNGMIRNFGERVAMNSPLQGTAADIMKIAMINVAGALKEAGLDARILVQVHDELLIEVADAQTEQVKAIVYEQMKNAASLAVALEVDVQSGSDWLECH